MDKETPQLKYFTSNPKGHLLEKHVKNNFPNFYTKLMKYPDELKFAERVYWYFNNLTEKPKCPICGRPPKFISFNEGYLQFCSYKCSMQSPERILKIKNTVFKRYGVENASQSQEIKDKKRKTSLIHYGVEYPLQSDEVKLKQKNTVLSRYGVINSFQIPRIKERSSNAFLEKFLSDHPDIIEVKNVDGVIIYVHKCIHSECHKCPGIFEIPATVFNNRFYSSSELCTNLLPVDNNHNSGGTLEIFIKNILDKYHIEYETNNRRILFGKELDIYIPSYNIAIECNGVYWHSLKEPMYHHNKWLECKNKGIQLLTLWEDQIINHPDIVKNIILSHLGIYGHKIGASKCKLQEVSSKESQLFLNENHIQGSVTGSVRYGLYYKDELISLMVFGRKRTSLGNKQHDAWELYRYCCKNGWSITAGSKRLFNHFIKEHPGVCVESFSSNDISYGAMYERLGFIKAGEQPFSYWYIDKNMIRHHRYSYRKDILVKNGADPNMTEFQITDLMGLFRIYDTGQIKWIFNT